MHQVRLINNGRVSHTRRVWADVTWNGPAFILAIVIDSPIPSTIIPRIFGGHNTASPTAEDCDMPLGPEGKVVGEQNLFDHVFSAVVDRQVMNASGQWGSAPLVISEPRDVA